MMLLPLTAGVPIGLVIALVGLVMLLSSRYKNVGAAVLIIGLLCMLATIALVVLVLASSM